jgi:serine palmitoyltransferase
MGSHEDGNDPEPTMLAAIATYFGYALLKIMGHLRDVLEWVYITCTCGKAPTLAPKGYAPLLQGFENFYTRRLYKRIEDCWNRPVVSCPGAWIDVMERENQGYGTPLVPTGNTRKCLNLGSYNYLGFGDPESPCKWDVFESMTKFPVSMTSARTALGTTSIHMDMEEVVARFVRKEAAICFSMGFGTNTTAIPGLVGKGGLIISDSINHSSIVVGARNSGAKIKVFNHNDPQHLESVIRQAIVEGQPLTRRPWTKILIVVEGIYSMEGEMCPLAEIVAIKKKYKCFLYMDEAHSIGAVGASGRGVTEYAGVHPDDIDILMGTFTKSFGSVGGYIAGNRDLIQHIRTTSRGSLCSPSISPPACQQVISALKMILGEDDTTIGAQKLTSLRENANYFRARMKQMGCHVLGNWDSPVVPVMLYNPAKIPAFSRECYDRNLAVVVVGFPAAPLLLSRTRFCISAAHTREDLDHALAKIEEVCDTVGIKYGSTMSLEEASEGCPTSMTYA